MARLQALADGYSMGRINVTKTFLPPLEEYEVYLEKIWSSGFITNQGPLLSEFESSIETYLDIDNFHFVSNGTSALQVALSALDLTEGEIITTPFSYVATTSSILWERCKPVFVDIEPNTYCIDPQKIETAITSETKAIMAVHVFGFPCDVERIQEIADAHNLKVIYDGAHAFGATYKGRSLLSFGDISTVSFHATKLFHTVEGGGIIARDAEVSESVDVIKRFGHTGDEHYRLGINAKASEIHAAMGLCNLKYINEILKDRERTYRLYDTLLGEAVLKPPVKIEDFKQNYAYYPVRFESEEILMRTVNALNKQDIHPRRYFYPSLNTLPYIEDYQQCPVSESVAKTILCLPLYKGLSDDDVRRISVIVNEQSK